MKFDAIVIGAGIVGLTSAYHLKKANPDLTIAVVESKNTYAQGNTGKATAGFRDLYSSEVNFLLSSSSISFYRHIQESKKNDMGMHFLGYLFLLTEEQMKLEVLEDLRKRTEAKFIDRQDLSQYGVLKLEPDAEVAAAMGLESISGGFLGTNCGIFEPDMICSYYYSELIKMGVTFFFGTEVLSLSLVPTFPLDYPGEPFIWQEKKIGKITTTKGDMEADVYVLANDIWATHLLDQIGIDGHFRPKKRQVFQVQGNGIENLLFNGDFNDEGIFPFTIIPKSGIHFRPSPKERGLRVSAADEVGRNFSFEEYPEPEKDFFDYGIKLVLQEYFPAFKDSSLRSMWAGYYSCNTLDAHPYIFREMNLIIATGTSGSGLMKGDAIGRMVESLFSDREKTHLYGNHFLDTYSLGVLDRKLPAEGFVL